MAHSMASGSASSGGGQSSHTLIHDLPPTQRRLLCDHLDELHVWPQLATLVSLRPTEIQIIRRQEALGHSPTEELLRIWGGQYNHSVTELFVVLRKQKLFQAMRLLKDHVEHKYRLLIPNSQPQLSDLIGQREPDAGSRQKDNSSKIINNNNETTSGVSDSNNDMYSTTTSSENASVSEGGSAQMARNVKEYASSMLEINYAELTAATKNWDDKLILGKGGFGTVYRGYWKHTEVAIKQIHYRSGGTERESVRVQIQQSLNELRFLNSCRHDNVLPLYGYSIRGEKPCLVYQWMKGGSLEQRLNSKYGLPPLSWQQRADICLGTARGINYLHTFRDKPLIHGDIKPANVLLDQCLQPKIGDFGLAREGPNAVNSAVEVSQVFGTKPYLPPEFINARRLSTQVDTFSYGVVLLETFSGLRVYDKNRPHPLLTRHVMKLCSSPDFDLRNLIDKKLALVHPVEWEICKRSLLLGVDCIADNPLQRPEMEQVLETLNYFYSLGNQCKLR